MNESPALPFYSELILSYILYENIEASAQLWNKSSFLAIKSLRAWFENLSAFCNAYVQKADSLHLPLLIHSPRELF